jgi:putative phosphonate metabolism protein
MSNVRYAVFFVPPADSALYRFGTAALGYDSYSGQDLPAQGSDQVPDTEWRQLTSEPRRYGFHATLKAPFRLRGDASEQDLIAAFEHVAATCSPPPAFPASIALLDDFAAMVPAAPIPLVNGLAEQCVREFDRFRSPLTEAERNRRLAQPLTARQIGYLERWGYPYVFEDFRFHMTLTGRLPAQRAPEVLTFLRHAQEEAQVPSEVTVETIALLRQDGPGARFRVVRDLTLGEPADRGPRAAAVLG